MKITKKWLEEKNACSDGIEWFVKNNQENVDSILVLEKLITKKKLKYANWLIVRTMSQPQCLDYAIYSAELVLHIFEKKYPDDMHPRQAIDAAKKVLKNDTIENRAVAYSASHYDAHYAAHYASYSAAYAVAYSASHYAAYYAAHYAAYSAAHYAAYYAAHYAADSDAYSTSYSAASLKKILDYGINLIK